MNISKDKITIWNSPLALKEVAAGMAATLLLFCSVLLIPIMGFLVGLLTPLPTLLFFFKWGSPLGYCMAAGTALLGFLLLSALDMVYSLPYLLEMLLLGLILGMGMRRRWSLEKTIGGGSSLICGISIALLYGMNGGHAGIVSGMEQDLHRTFAMILDQYGVGSSDKELIKTSLENSIPLLVRLLPAIVLSSTLIASWLNTLIALRYCKSHRSPMPEWTQWSLWKSPDFLVWGVVGSGFTILMPHGTLKIIALNMLLVLGTIYLFQGLAILSFYFERWKLPRMLRGIIYGFLFLQLFATLGATLMGLFDVWFDFRRISRTHADGT